MEKMFEKGIDKKGIDKRALSILGFIIFTASLIAFIIVFLFVPHKQEYTVQSKSWVRTIEVESLQKVTDSGWSVPKEKRNLKVTDKQRKYRRTDNVEYGKRRSHKAIYDDYYTFEYEEFKVSRKVISYGNQDKNSDPYWEEVILNKHDTLQLGDERTGKEIEEYEVKVFEPKNPSKTKTFTLSYDDYIKANPDTKLVFEVSRIFKKAKIVEFK